MVRDGMGASNRDINNHLSLDIIWEGADYLQVAISVKQLFFVFGRFKVTDG